MDQDILETIENKFKEKDYKIKITAPEFTCLCPNKRDQPDFATIIITYVPSDKLIELKSLKYYFVNYRDKEIYHEHATNRILEDLKDTLNPRYIKVKGDWNIRGGIKTIVEVEYMADDWKYDPRVMDVKVEENTALQGKNSQIRPRKL
ncbi:MAG: preQ(1) synthase [Thermoplasmatota archaeon]